MSGNMLLRELLPDVAALPPYAGADAKHFPGDLRITGLVMDSREVTPGSAFVAIAGFGAHGLKFVDQAHTLGASVILFEPPAPVDLPAPSDAIAVPNLRARLGELANRFHGRVTEAMTMVGVTGTNGKTSTVQLLAQAWTLRGTRGLPSAASAAAMLPTAKGPAARLFAFGFDAWQLTAYLERLATTADGAVEGATGVLRMDGFGVVQRTPAWSTFSGGVAVPLADAARR